MQYEIKPLTPEEAEAIEEKIDELDRSVVPPEEGAAREEIVLIITDGNGAIIAGCAALRSSVKASAAIPAARSAAR